MTDRYICHHPRPNILVVIVTMLTVIVSVLAPVVNGAGLPLASRSTSKQMTSDVYRKGHTTRLADITEQDDLDRSVRAYRRGASGTVADRHADLAAGPGGAYVADGGQRFGHSGEFDRGQLAVNRTRTVQQVGDVISAGFDTGAVVDKAAALAQIGARPGTVSAGARSVLGRVGRRQDLADAEHIDQYSEAALTDQEIYDRGVKNGAGSSNAIIAGNGLSSGSSSADFAATRDRAAFVNTIPDAGITVDQRHVRRADRAINDMASAKAADSGAVFGPLAAAGREHSLEDVRTHQIATHHGRVDEQHTFDAPVERHLQSDWVKGQKMSQAAIDGVTGSASGSAAKRIATGFDQVDTMITIANRARKQTATDSAEFDDRHAIRAADSGSILN